MKKCLMAVISSAALALSAGQGFPLVENGQARAAIVTPAAPVPVVQYAADELKNHIQLMTGCELPVVTEDKLPGGFDKFIYLGNTKAVRQWNIDVDKLPINSTVRKVTDDAVYLFGLDGDGVPPLDDSTPMGTLFAVYDFLNSQLDVKWLWPGDSGTYVPREKTIFSGPPREIIKRQQLMHSRMRDGSGLGDYSKVMSKEEFDRAKLERQTWLRRHQFACGTSFQYGHAFEHYWERFGKTHPEYFALRSDGKRDPNSPKRPELVQLCVSNPDLHKQIIEDWVNNIQSYKGPFINGAENDKTAADEHCFCEKCLAWDPPSRRMPVSEYLNAAKKKAMPDILSDRYARFWLALQREGAKHRDNPIVLGYAYSDYSAPPIETKLNENIIVAIVPRMNYPLEPEARGLMTGQWDGWRAAGARLYLRPNYFLNGYTLPYIFARQFGEDYKHAYANGMIGTDFDSLTGMFGTQGPNLYMVARLNDNPELSVDEVLTDFYSGFGKAAPKAKEYFELWENATNGYTREFARKNPGGGWNYMGFSGNELYSMELVAKAEAILADAMRLAQDSPDDVARVRFLEKGLKHTRLTLEAMNAFDAFKKKRSDREAKRKFLEARGKLNDYRQEIRNDQVVNVVIPQRLEQWMGWNVR